MVIRGLETERLVLRELQAGDWKALQDTAAVRMLEDAYLHQEQGPLARIYVEQAIAERKRVPRRRYEFAIVAKAGRRVIGACSLKLTRGVLVEADIGYIIRPDHWNHGFATEAAGRLVRLAFAELGVFRLTAHCEATNPASVRVLRKLGLNKVGENRERLLFARVRPLNLGEHEPVTQTAHRNL